MKSLGEYVDSYLNFKSAEQSFMDEFTTMLGLDSSHIREIRLKTVEQDTKILQFINIKLTGENRIRACDIKKIEGAVIITPNTIEIEVGEIPL